MRNAITAMGRGLGLLILVFAFGSTAFAADVPATDVAHLAVALNAVWVAVAGSLVFFMQAGFAMLESGMVRAKNTVNVLMKNYTDMCFGGIAFWMVGYGLMFGSNPSGWLGVDHFFVGQDHDVDYGVLFFQMMFAATAATVVSGALAERVRYPSYIIGSIVITALIYPVFGSWAWGSLYAGSGWLKAMGFIDFAGSTVVHSLGGWCALAGIIGLGPRLGRYGDGGSARMIPGHNLTMVALGGFILWLGWFGFNGGSTLAAGPEIGGIILNTHLAASAGVVSAMLAMVLFGKPILMTTTINGGLAGLVAITAGCATMDPLFAVTTGFLAGILMVIAMDIMDGMRWDDPVGVVAVHGVCGAWGTLAAGMFKHGDMFNGGQILVQLLGIGVAFVWAFGTAYASYRLIDYLIRLRASSLAQQRGLDFVEHYEIGYPEFQRDVLHAGKE